MAGSEGCVSSQRNKGRAPRDRGTRSLRDFQSEGCPGPTKRTEDSRGMAGEEFSRSLSVSGSTDHE